VARQAAPALGPQIVQADQGHQDEPEDRRDAGRREQGRAPGGPVGQNRLGEPGSRRRGRGGHDPGQARPVVPDPHRGREGDGPAFVVPHHGRQREVVAGDPPIRVHAGHGAPRHHRRRTEEPTPDDEASRESPRRELDHRAAYRAVAQDPEDEDDHQELSGAQGHRGQGEGTGDPDHRPADGGAQNGVSPHRGGRPGHRPKLGPAGRAWQARALPTIWRFPSRWRTLLGQVRRSTSQEARPCSHVKTTSC
jgi:hypothetical protein